MEKVISSWSIKAHNIHTLTELFRNEMAKYTKIQNIV